VAVGKGLDRIGDKAASTGFGRIARESAKRAYTIAAAARDFAVAAAALSLQLPGTKHDLERHDADREKGKHGLRRSTLRRATPRR